MNSYEIIVGFFNYLKQQHQNHYLFLWRDVMKYLLLTGLLLISSFTQAKQATSDLGYSIEIPDSWLPLTGPEIKANPDLFNFEQVDGLSPALLEQIVPVIQSGKMDIYFIPRSTDNTANNFTDNINIMKQIGSVPNNLDQVTQVCAAAKSELNNLFQRDINMYECKQTDVKGKNALYTKFDGALPGTISTQYHIALSENVFLMFTATAKSDTYESIEKPFRDVINTLNIR